MFTTVWRVRWHGPTTSKADVEENLASSRLIKYRGLHGVLLALPLVALGGYAIIAAGAGLSLVRWIKTAENATDYSIMNTARQLLWLPTTREDKYKAKQAIDTFFMRSGDLLSAMAVYVGSQTLNLSVEQFALINIFLTLAWIGVALRILAPRTASTTLSLRPRPGSYSNSAARTVTKLVAA